MTRRVQLSPSELDLIEAVRDARAARRFGIAMLNKPASEFLDGDEGHKVHMVKAAQSEFASRVGEVTRLAGVAILSEDDR